MKKRTKIMLAFVSVLIMLFAVGCATKEPKDDANKDKEVKEESTYVVYADGLLALKYSDGTKEMSFVQGDTLWYYEPDETISLEQDVVLTMVSTFAKIKATQEIEKPGALKEYGLKTPSYTVEIKNLEGNVTTLYIGNAVDGGYYATIDDKSDVYVIAEDVVNALVFDIEMFKDNTGEIQEDVSETMPEESVTEEEAAEPITEE